MLQRHLGPHQDQLLRVDGVLVEAPWDLWLRFALFRIAIHASWAPRSLPWHQWSCCVLVGQELSPTFTLPFSICLAAKRQLCRHLDRLLLLIGHQEPDVTAMDQKWNDLSFTAGVASHKVVHLELPTAVQSPALQRHITQLLDHEGLE